MSGFRSLTSFEGSEYDRIEAAMSESDRGRWFLDEYARRNRSADTEVLLSAIGRLESAVTGDREADRLGRVRGDLMDMAHAIARTKAEIGAINAPDHDQNRLGVASAALDGIVRSTERATSDILSAAEDVQEAAWTLREAGADPAVCDILDRRATEIYTACSFQDLTAQRTARIIHTLRYLEERLTAMIAIWSDDLDAVPAAPDDGSHARAEAKQVVEADLSQTDVDRFIAMQAPSEGPATIAPLPDIGPLDDDILFLHADGEADSMEATPPELESREQAPPDDVAEGPATHEAVVADEADRHERAERSVRLLDAMDETIDAAAVVDGVAEDDAVAPEIPDSEKVDVASAFADIDRLTDEEKQALFS